MTAQETRAAVLALCPGPISSMVHLGQIGALIDAMRDTRNVPGDIAEFGCNVGTTTIYLGLCRNLLCPEKRLFVYDSFQGLPEKGPLDECAAEYAGLVGPCKTTAEILLENTARYGVTVDRINRGWFRDIPAAEHPQKISLAFFDGDLHASILDSFKIAYGRMSAGGAILVHDYGWEPLPGVKRACDEFLVDKPEHIECVASYLGLMVKA
jgi:O-methyltransferase